MSAGLSLCTGFASCTAELNILEPRASILVRVALIYATYIQVCHHISQWWAGVFTARLHGVHIVQGVTQVTYKTSIRVVPSSAVPWTSYAIKSVGRETAEVGQEKLLPLQLCDRFGNLLQHGGDFTRFNIAIVPEVDIPQIFSERPDVVPTRWRMVDNEDGTYLLLYTIFPWAPYRIAVALSTVDSATTAMSPPRNISNSPVAVDMLPTVRTRLHTRKTRLAYKWCCLRVAHCMLCRLLPSWLTCASIHLSSE